MAVGFGKLTQAVVDTGGVAVKLFFGEGLPAVAADEAVLAGNLALVLKADSTKILVLVGGVLFTTDTEDLHGSGVSDSGEIGS